MNKDYCYRILELNKNATKSDLEKSYRNLALKYHPDKNNSTDAVEKFKKIKDSYDFLKNIIKNDFVDTKNSVDSIFDSLYYEVFSNKKDTKIRLSITFEDAYFGCKKEIDVYNHKYCKNCEGTGGESWIYCEKCLGKGYIYKENSLSIQSACVYCEGKGSLIQNKCKDCHGNGFIKGEKKKEIIEIPAGIKNNTQIRYSEKGEGGGDLYIIVLIKDSLYKRNEENVVFDIYVPYTILVLGGDFSFVFLGQNKTIKVKAGTKIGSKIIIENLGFHSLENRKRGNLELLVNLKYPNKMDKNYKKALNSLLEFEKES